MDYNDYKLRPHLHLTSTFTYTCVSVAVEIAGAAFLVAFLRQEFECIFGCDYDGG